MIYVISGPPCSGKTTHINNNAKPNDIVIDMDKIAFALLPDGAQDYDDKVRKIAMMARKAAVQEAVYQMQGERQRTLWIIHTDPDGNQRMAYRAMNARIVEFDPGREVCLERLAARSPHQQKIARPVIDEYYLKRG
jgi:hypothetical protein